MARSKGCSVSPSCSCSRSGKKRNALSRAHSMRTVSSNPPTMAATKPGNSRSVVTAYPASSRSRRSVAKEECTASSASWKMSMSRDRRAPSRSRLRAAAPDVADSRALAVVGYEPADGPLEIRECHRAPLRELRGAALRVLIADPSQKSPCFDEPATVGAGCNALQHHPRHHILLQVRIFLEIPQTLGTVAGHQSPQPALEGGGVGRFVASVSFLVISGV